MGWDQGDGALHVSGEQNTTAGWITWSLEALEYAYNLGAVVEMINDGGVGGADTDKLFGFLQRSQRASFATMNFALRGFIWDDAELSINLIQAGSSFTIKFGGFAKAIKAIASVFDPQMRADRAEDLRHKQVMNGLAEEDERTRVARNRLDLLLPTMLDSSSNFSATTHYHQPEFNHLLNREFDRALSILGANTINVLEPAPDENG